MTTDINAELDRQVAESIRLDDAFTQSDLARKLGCEARRIDNSLKRLKERGLISFDRTLKRWKYLMPGLPPIDHITSAESAPAPEAEVQSVQTAATPQKETDMTTNTADVAAIDSQIAAAKKAKKTSPTTGSKRPRLSAEEKAQREADRAAEKARKQSERTAAREARKAEREATKKPAHMSKVNKAFSKLPSLNDEAQELFTNVTASFDRDQLAALAAHLNHFNRTRATERALSQKLTAGDTVLIKSGDPRFVGLQGTVAKAQRIRCYVEVEGSKKPIYLFTSDVEVVAKAVPTAKAS